MTQAQDPDIRLPAAAYLRYESRADGWSAGRQAAFLAHLADNGLVEDAARSVGMGVGGGYSLRRTARGYAFSLGWEAALIIARRVISDRLMTAAIKGEEARWVREDGVTTYTRQNTKLSLALLDRVNPALSQPEVIAVAVRFDCFLQMIDEGLNGAELWELFFDKALPPGDRESRERVRHSLLLSEDSAGFEEKDEPPIEYKSMEGVVTDEEELHDSPPVYGRGWGRACHDTRLAPLAPSPNRCCFATPSAPRTREGDLASLRENNGALRAGNGSTPGAAAALVPAGEAFIDKDAAKALPAARQDAQFAAEPVFIAIDAFKAERARIDERVHPLRRLLAERRLLRAARLMRFGGIDIGDADLGAAIINGVAIDDAIGAAAGMAKGEGGALAITAACGARHGGRSGLCRGGSEFAILPDAQLGKHHRAGKCQQSEPPGPTACRRAPRPRKARDLVHVPPPLRPEGRNSAGWITGGKA
jgi:hypothetical protein